MGNKEDQAKIEIEIFEQALSKARSKGGEAKRNVDRILGKIEPYDRPDILIRTDSNQIIGIEHFRVDQCITQGKKKSSKSAEFSNKAERFRKQHEASVRKGELPEEAYQGFGDLISQSIKLKHDSCVDDIAKSLDAGLFGEDNRGHVAKLNTYKNRLSQFDKAGRVELGFLIEFHTDLQNWFLNEGITTRKVLPGEFPLSSEVYYFLEKASKEVDWMILAFCSSYSQSIIDAAVVDCRNHKFKASMTRQKLVETAYLGLGKEGPFKKQQSQGKVEFKPGLQSIQYLIENTSEPIDPREMLFNAIDSTATALNLEQADQPFAASLPVQLCYCLVRDSLKHTKKQITPNDVSNTLAQLSSYERNALCETFRTRWNIGPY